MARNKSKSLRRSACPVSTSLEVVGDRWSLLVIRDLMVRGYHTFKQFQESGEGIATNILADRLRKLETAGIITAAVEKTDGRRVDYGLTEKGIDLAPVVLELLIWGSRHEQMGAPYAFMEQMARNREQVLAEVRRRWRESDRTPLIPAPSSPKPSESQKPPSQKQERRKSHGADATKKRGAGCGEFRDSAP